MKYANFITSALAVVALAGCITQMTSPGYTPAVQVQFTTPESIKLLWHEGRIAEPEVEAMAVAYCKGRSVRATDAGAHEGFRWKNWSCT